MPKSAPAKKSAAKAKTEVTAAKTKSSSKAKAGSVRAKPKIPAKTVAKPMKRKAAPVQPKRTRSPQPTAAPNHDQLWTTVDRYLVDMLVPQDAALTASLDDSDQAGLPAISVAPNQGKFLHLLAKISGARRILEIGTLGGYSAIWLARALPPGGKLVTLEIDPRHADVATKNLARAGLADLATVILGRAVESLADLVEAGAEPFDFVFIDADKASIPEYFALTLKLIRAGGVIVVDNVVRRGLVADAASTDANVLGVRRLNEIIAAEPRVTATSVQTVGSKGHDGFTLILVNA